VFYLIKAKFKEKNVNIFEMRKPFKNNQRLRLEADSIVKDIASENTSTIEYQNNSDYEVNNELYNTDFPLRKPL
jgi:hypothetical protein